MLSKSNAAATPAIIPAVEPMFMDASGNKKEEGVENIIKTGLQRCISRKTMILYYYWEALKIKIKNVWKWFRLRGMTARVMLQVAERILLVEVHL